MNRTIRRLSLATIGLGLVLLAGAILLHSRVRERQYVSLGSLGPYSFLADREGVLVSRHVLQWHRVRALPLATALMVIGSIGAWAARPKVPGTTPE